MRKTICRTVVGLLFCATAPVSGQLKPYPRGDRLTVAVRATAVLLGGDTVRVSHTVRNMPSSVLELHLFILRTLSTFTAVVEIPVNSPYWHISTGNLQDSASITWVTTSPQGDVAAGDSAVGFTHKAVGELDIVAYYAQGYVPSPAYDEEKGDTLQDKLPLWKDALKGYTIAVVPFAREMTPAAMIQRLLAVAERACELQFVTQRSVCANTQARLRLALHAAQTRGPADACAQLNAFVAEVSNVRGSVITPDGRALFTVRSQQFLNRHCR